MIGIVLIKTNAIRENLSIIKNFHSAGKSKNQNSISKLKIKRSFLPFKIS